MELSDSELEATKEEDEEWVSIKEESILFNEAFVATKYNELDEERENEKEDDELLAEKASKEENKVLTRSYYCNF
jgi:hypothetical protein